MTLPLLSVFKTYPERHCSLSEAGKRDQNISINLTFYYANKVLMGFTILWIIYMLGKYKVISQRSPVLFQPLTLFGKIVMPQLPSPLIYYTAGIIALLLSLSIIIYKDNSYLRAALAFLALWLNLLPWSFGAQSAVANMLLLAHLFGIFIPSQLLTTNRNSAELRKSIECFYLGLLITYTYSGLWKFFGLAYKLAFKPWEISWLSSKAALYNALIMHHKSDLPLDSIPRYFSFPLFWQISFLIMSFLLSVSFLASFRQPLRVWTGLWLILFHFVNALVFDIYFIAAPCVIACLFFPYFLVISGIRKEQSPIYSRKFCGTKQEAVYYRFYANGDKDEFRNYYAYREKINDDHPLTGGILYIPLADLAVTIFWKIQKKWSFRNSYISH